MTAYTFTDASGRDARIEVTGRYTDGNVDLSASFDGYANDWQDVDAGSASEVIRWVADHGFEFESRRSAAYNVDYVASVLVDRDATAQSLRAECARWDTARIDLILEEVEDFGDSPIRTRSRWVADPGRGFVGRGWRVSYERRDHGERLFSMRGALDGMEAVIDLHVAGDLDSDVTDAADRVIDRIESGWRPVNLAGGAR